MTAAARALVASSPLTPALRVFEYCATSYRRIWRGSLFSTFLSPVLFLASMGIGLGAFVDQSSNGALGGVSYAAWLAPGLLAGQAMQTAGFESTWPILGSIVWDRTYLADAQHAGHRPGDHLRPAGLDRLPADAGLGGVLRRHGGVRARRLAARRPGDPGRRPDRPCLRGPDLRLLGDPAERAGVHRALPVRAHPDVPVQRHVLPDRAAARAAPAGRRGPAAPPRGRPRPPPVPRRPTPTGATSSSTWSCSSPTSSSGPWPASSPSAGRW